MSLAVAIFGQPRKVTEQTHPPQLNGPMAMLPGPKWLSLRPASFEGGRAAQYDQSPGLGQQACEECTPQKGQLADQALPRATTSTSSAGWASPKRQKSPTRYETKKQPRKALQVSQQPALTPTQPAGTSPDHLLPAEQRAGTSLPSGGAGRELIGPSLARPPTPAAAQGRPTRANKILRWLGSFMGTRLWASTLSTVGRTSTNLPRQPPQTVGTSKALRQGPSGASSNKTHLVAGFWSATRSARCHVMPGGTPFRLHRSMITMVVASAYATPPLLPHHQ